MAMLDHDTRQMTTHITVRELSGMPSTLVQMSLDSILGQRAAGEGFGPVQQRVSVAQMPERRGTHRVAR